MAPKKKAAKTRGNSKSSKPRAASRPVKPETIPLTRHIRLVKRQGEMTMGPHARGNRHVRRRQYDSPSLQLAEELSQSSRVSTLDVTNDLIQKSTIVHTYSLIEKLPRCAGPEFGCRSGRAHRQHLPVEHPVSRGERGARVARWAFSDTIATKPGDPGGYVVWVNGITTKNFSASLDGEVFTYRVYAWVRDTDFLVASQQWLFVVSGEP